MPEIVLGSVMNERLQSLLTAFFASAALLMAALGVYGVVSYAVRHRTVEIGTRMALGAVGRDVLRLVLGDGLENGGVRDRIGGVAVIAAVFLLKSEIFGIRIDGPLPFLFSTGIVAGITALACFFPGWRATLVAPMAAIRDDPGSIWRSARTGARGLAKRVSGLIAGSVDEAAVSEGALMAEFVDSSRHAESFRQAIQLALEALREAIRCESAVLLEKSSGAGVPFGGARARRAGNCLHGARGRVTDWPAARLSLPAAADARRLRNLEPMGGGGEARACSRDREPSRRRRGAGRSAAGQERNCRASCCSARPWGAPNTARRRSALCGIARDNSRS